MCKGQKSQKLGDRDVEVSVFTFFFVEYLLTMHFICLG